MKDWEDWRSIYGKFIFASISEPTRILNEFEAWDQKIDLLSEITSDFISYSDLNDIVQELFLLTFNYTHGQYLTQTEFLGNYFQNLRFIC